MDSSIIIFNTQEEEDPSSSSPPPSSRAPPTTPHQQQQQQPCDNTNNNIASTTVTDLAARVAELTATVAEFANTQRDIMGHLSLLAAQVAEVRMRVPLIPPPASDDDLEIIPGTSTSGGTSPGPFPALCGARPSDRASPSFIVAAPSANRPGIPYQRRRHYSEDDEDSDEDNRHYFARLNGSSPRKKKQPVKRKRRRTGRWVTKVFVERNNTLNASRVADKTIVIVDSDDDDDVENRIAAAAAPELSQENLTDRCELTGNVFLPSTKEEEQQQNNNNNNDSEEEEEEQSPRPKLKRKSSSKSNSEKPIAKRPKNKPPRRDRRAKTPCPKCPLSYPDNYKLREHLKFHKSSPDRPHICTKCDLHYKTPAALKNHSKLIHNNKQPLTNVTNNVNAATTTSDVYDNVTSD